LHDGQELPEVIAAAFTNCVETLGTKTSKVPNLASFCKQTRARFQRDFHRLFTGKEPEFLIENDAKFHQKLDIDRHLRI